MTKIQMTKTDSKECGITLIELIMVMTIFAFLSAGLGASLFSGMKLWGRAKNTDASSADALLLLEKISAQMHSCVRTPLIPCQGEKMRISFPTLQGGELIEAGYAFRPESKSVVYRQRGVKEIAQQGDFASAQERPVGPADSFWLAYLSPAQAKASYQWSDTWPKEKGRFAAVRINLTLNQKEYVKTVFIPDKQ